MAHLLLLIFAIATVSCSTVDPLSTESPGSETVATEEDTNALLERLDELPGPGGVDSEIADIRSKLAQTTITRIEFLLLQRRVDALENKFADWAQVNTSESSALCMLCCMRCRLLTISS